MQFKASNLRFLIKHQFDFNKLFAEGTTFQRLSDATKIAEKIRVNIDFGRTVRADTKNLGDFNYSAQRSFTSIGRRSVHSLDDYIRKVQNFVMLAKQTPEHWGVLEIEIESYALRRRLSQAL